jgi:hypothetical protein
MRRAGIIGNRPGALPALRYKNVQLHALNPVLAHCEDFTIYSDRIILGAALASARHDITCNSPTKLVTFPYYIVNGDFVAHLRSISLTLILWIPIFLGYSRGYDGFDVMNRRGGGQRI